MVSERLQIKQKLKDLYKSYNHIFWMSLPLALFVVQIFVMCIVLSGREKSKQTCHCIGYYPQYINKIIIMQCYGWECIDREANE